jgi:hypothetical protein
VRNKSEKLVRLGASLIRVNIDHPKSDASAKRTVSLRMSVLDSLSGIDMALRRLRGV